MISGWKQSQFLGAGHGARAGIRQLYVRIILAVAILASACVQVVPSNERFEMHLRLIRHTSVPNTLAANVGIANDVWQTGTIEVYDSTNLFEAAWLPYDSCGLRIVPALSEITSQPMTTDSVLTIYQIVTNGLDTGFAYTPDATGYFLPFQPINYAADTVPVLIVPYLGVVQLDGDVDIFNIGGHAAWDPESSLASSVWLASELIELAGAQSLLAHELGHLLLPTIVFPDNPTAFVNIMDYADGRMKYRRVPGFGTALELVATNDTNIRQLIEVQGTVVQNQCTYALTSANVLRLSQTP